MTPLPISAFTVTSALGAGREAHWRALRTETSGLRKIAFDTNTLDCWLGEVAGFDTPLPVEWAKWDCRNHRLALFGLQQDDFLATVAALRRRYGADRIGVFIGTSTSGVQHTELAYRERDPGTQRLPDWFQHRYTQNIYSIAAFVAQVLDLKGPTLAISTACSSSAKVFASARRAIAAGTCDAAIVGGVDSLCLTTLYGFNSLQLVSADICRPADAARGGISIGEAAGFAALDPQAHTPLALLGYGETSDAYHMSSPDPDGLGAAGSMRAALACANLTADAVDYVNLHGTKRSPTTCPKAAPLAPSSAHRRRAVPRRAGPVTRSARPASSKPPCRCSASSRISCRAASILEPRTRRSRLRSCSTAAPRRFAM